MKNLACSQLSLSCQVFVVFNLLAHESSKYLSKHNKGNILVYLFHGILTFLLISQRFLQHKVAVKLPYFMYIQ